MSGCCDDNKHRCCNTCKHRRLFEDTFDRNVHDGGRRLLFRCEAKDTPILVTVVERESVPEMQLVSSCLSTFWCCRYVLNETKEEGEKDGSGVA